MINKSYIIIIIFFVSAIISGKTLCKDRYSIKVDGYDRYYTVYPPETIEKDNPCPLVFLLHGGGGNVKLLMRQFGNRLVELANADNAIVVVPEALEKAWNDGREYKKLYKDNKKPDDIKFIKKLKLRLLHKFPIDKNKIYVSGPSTGGTMTYRIVLEIGNIAAAACIISNLPVKLYNKYKDDTFPNSITPILIMNGTKDPLMPWNGGPVRTPGRQKRDDVLSTEETVNFWIKRNKCITSPVESKIKDLNHDDNTETTKFLYKSTVPGSEVILYKISNGGHQYPSTQKVSRFYQSKFMTKILGNKPKDFDSPDIIWDFFKSH